MLTGHVPKAAKGLTPVDSLDASKELRLAIGLPLRNKEALSNLIERLYDPAAPEFHHFLTPAEFTGQFGPTEEDYHAVIAFAEANGLKVETKHPNRMLLDVSGNVEKIERVLHLKLRVYQHPAEKRTFYAPDSEPSLDLAVPVADISGLNDYAMPHPRFKMKPGSGGKFPAENSGSAPGGNFMGNDFRAAYAPGSPLTGAGQSVGLLEFDGYTGGDITYYEDQAKLPHVPLVNVLMDGADGSPNGGEVEVSLDIEMAVSMAPGLNSVIVYDAGLYGNWHDILSRMANDNSAKQLSCSWYSSSTVDDPVADQIFQQMAAQGQSFFDAAGDYGAYSSSIGFPGDNPYITQVGGTTLTTAGPGGRWVSEKVWNWGNGIAGAGGVSTIYSIPSWQARVDMSLCGGSTTMRNIPDVALTADNIYVRVDGFDYIGVGGTSAAAPLWAGYTALINQQSAMNGRPPMGFINPAIYALGLEASYTLGLHDITVGSNATPSSPGKFLAIPGFDLCTGWGTPFGTNLINALVPPTDPLQIIPELGFASVGPVNGPFTPAGQNYTLKNLGTSNLSWSLQNTSTWLNASAASGQLNPYGGLANVMVDFNSVASNLAGGSYATTLWVTNLNTGFVQSRQFSLLISNVPVAITMQPTNQGLLPGQTATFNVGAVGTRLSYYWRKNGAPLSDGGNISGSQTSVLTVSGASVADAADYTVIVSNLVDQVTSAGAALIVYSPAGGQIAQNGGFETGDFTGWTLSGDTNLATVGTNGGVVHSGNYGAQFESSGFPVQLSQNLPTVPGAIYIVSAWLDSPDGESPNQFMMSWGGATLYSASDLGPLGWTNFQYTVSATDTNTAIEFQFQDDPSFLALDDVTVMSYTNIASPPVIVSQPVSQTVPPGGTFDFTVAATGNAPLSYIWMTNGVPVPGATGSNFTGAAQSYAGDQFTCVISNVFGVLSSSTVLLTVAGPIYTFNGPDGGEPFGPLMQASDGNFYGTTEYGGVYGGGTVFRVTPYGSLSTLVSFHSFVNGQGPVGGLVQGSDGNLYGTTQSGGTYNNGTIFRITTNGVLTTLLSFNYGVNGGYPAAALVLGNDGNFYGTTSEGGAHSYGTVFRMTTNGTLTTLVSLSSGSGTYPYGPLVQGNDGNFYGTTSEGGANNYGTVFLVTTNGSLTNLAAFDLYNSGGYPYSGLVQGSDGNFCGTASQGGFNTFGTIFQFTSYGTNGTLTVLAALDNLNSGAAPYGGLIQGADGAFYGTTSEGGAYGGGTMFRITTNGAFNNLVSFAGTNGANSQASLIQATDGNFYGTTVFGGVGYNGEASNGVGSVFCYLTSPRVELTGITAQPASQFTPIAGAATFSVLAASSAPINYFWQSNGTPIPGATQSSFTVSNAPLAASGAQYSCLVSNALGSVQSSNATLTVQPFNASGPLFLFNQPQGGLPAASLLLAPDGYFYGTTAFGGQNNAGSVFKTTVNGPVTTLASFDYAKTGGNPYGRLLLGADGNFYGTATAGGLYGYGTIFRMTPDGALTNLVSFNYLSTGGMPTGGLVQGADGAFYGTTFEGGAYGEGTVFQLTTNGTLITLVTFTYLNGALPFAGLTPGTDGNFYGTTAEGGTYGLGTTFRLTPAGQLTTLVNFNGVNGYIPYAPLFLGTDGNFYGTMMGGGSQGYGTVFRTSGGSISTLCNLTNSTTGSEPIGGVVEGPDGNFYGATAVGGANNAGAVFRVTPGGGVSVPFTFNGANGISPIGGPAVGADGNLYGTALYGGMGYDSQLSSGNGVLYSVVVTNTQGPAQIVVQPVSTNATVGDIALFSVYAIGSPPLSYSWLSNGALIPGANAAAYAVPNVQISNSWSQFSCLVSNAFGTAQSTNVTLTVHLPSLVTNGGFETGDFTGWILSGNTNDVTEATVTTTSTYVHSGHYGARLRGIGSPVYLSETLATTPGANCILSFWLDNPTAGTPNNFQVFWNSNVICNLANFSSVAWTNFQFLVTPTSSNTVFTLEAADSSGYFGLDDVSVIPLPQTPPSILQQPTNQTVFAGSPAAFGLFATGDLPLSYYWMRNGAPIAGATNSTFLTNNVQLADSGAQFSCLVSNAYGTLLSSNATLTVLGLPPTVTKQPANLTLFTGGAAVFSVTGGGSSPLYYYWLRNQIPIAAAANSSSYITNNVQLADSGAQFSCLVSNAFGTMTSSNAILTVVAGNQDVVTFDDLANSGGGLQVPNNYHGVTWSNIVELNAVNFPLASGVQVGLISSNNVALNNHGGAASISSTNLFSLQSAYLTAVWDQGLQVQALGYYGGLMLYSNLFVLSATNSTLVNFNYSSVTSVVFVASGGTPWPPYGGSAATLFAMDNVTLLRAPTNFAPAIVSQPNNLTAYIGASAGFNVGINGTAPLTYDWFCNGVPIAGATNANYTTNSVQLSDSGKQFTCAISNSFGFTNTHVATLTVIPVPPTILIPPASTNVNAGSTATFSVLATSTYPLNYRWILNATNYLTDGGIVSGSATPMLTLSNVMGVNGGTYSVLVSNFVGSVLSVGAGLTVNDPYITVHPQNQTALIGTNATFSVSLIGTAPQYQWYMDGNPLDFGTNSNLTYGPLMETDQGDVFNVVITGPYGVATSDNAMLTVAAGQLVSPGITVGGQFQATLENAPDGEYIIEVSTDLTNWTPIATNDSAGGLLQFIDPSTTNGVPPFTHFYRAMVSQ